MKRDRNLFPETTTRFCGPFFRIKEDSIPEDNETLTLTLSSSRPEVTFEHRHIYVTIIDDDRKYIS